MQKLKQLFKYKTKTGYGSEGQRSPNSLVEDYNRLVEAYNDLMDENLQLVKELERSKQEPNEKEEKGV